jgi:hypothetical protein
MTPEQIVQKQLDAYSQCDLDAFAATYTKDVKVVDGAGRVLCDGIADLRRVYGPLFESNPNQMAIITQRITARDYVIDDETVIGRADGKRCRAVAIYRIREGRIAHVTLIPKTDAEQ